MRLLTRIVILALVCASPAAARAQSAASSWDFPDFSATQVLRSTKYEMAAKVYRSDAAARAEYNSQLTRLFVPANSKIYNLTVYPDGSRTCVASPPDRGMGLPNLLELLYGGDARRTVVRSEVVEGHPTSVEDVVVSKNDGQSVRFTVWLAQDLQGVPVKIESDHTGMKLTAVYRDIVLRSPDKSLFAVPDRCIPVDRMGQIAEQKVYN
jgi:hypothetical protein